MTAPNIVSVTTIIGKTAAVDLTTTSATEVVSNAASSGKVFKINTLMVANVDGASNAVITVSLYSAASISGTATELASTIIVPFNTTLVVVSKDNPIYLEEDRSIGATASTSNDLKIICSFEEIN